MSDDVMCCGRCGNALKIVCPEHGTEFVPDRRMEAPPADAPERTTVVRRKTSAVQRGEIIAKPGSLTEAILLALACYGTTPMTAHQVAGIVNRDAKLVGIYLAQLTREGRCTRLRQGEYGP
jgi:phenylpropionate dioxygenase-like ring-hydroxylating dioxygenase large terminal subunit